MIAIREGKIYLHNCSFHLVLYYEYVFTSTCSHNWSKCFGCLEVLILYSGDTHVAISSLSSIHLLVHFLSCVVLNFGLIFGREGYVVL